MACGLVAGLLASCGGGAGPGVLTSLGEASRAVPAAVSVATLSGNRSGYTITRTATGYNVRNNATGTNTAVGTGVNLKFADVTVNLGMGDAANSIAPEALRNLTELYVAFFNRVPDADGLSYWISQYNAGQSLEQIAAAFYAAALQFSSTTGYSATMANADFVKIVYKNVLGRSGTLAPPDADVQYWVNQLTTGAASRGTLVNTMLSAAHNYAFDGTWSWVSKLLDNKVAVANYFAVQHGLTYNTPEDSISRTVAIAALVTQTGTTAAIAQVGVSDNLNLSAAGCAQGVTTGFAGNIETTAANTGSSNSDTGGSGGAGGGGSAGGGGLGKVLGGLMRVTDLFDGTVVGQAVTDQNTGLVTIRTCTRMGPFLLTLEGQPGAKYFDEGLNALTDFGPGNVLNALVDRWDEHVGVSPLTEAAYRYALNNFKQDPAKVAAGTLPLASSGSLTGMSADQVRLANNLVRDQVNTLLTTNVQLASARTLPVPLDSSSGTNVLADNRYGRAGAVKGGLVKAANDYNPGIAAPALSYVSDLARDLTDGRINGFALDGTPVSASDKASYDSVRAPLASQIGTNAMAQRFSKNNLAARLSVDEFGFLLLGSATGKTNSFPDNVDCNGFFDEVGLLSDGSVTLIRRLPTNLGTRCAYTNSAEENGRVQTTRNFLTNVKQLSGNGQVVYAVKRDGSVVAWGENYCGVIDPALAGGFYRTPQVIPGLKDVTSIAASFGAAIARDKSGNVFTWGNYGSSSNPAVPAGTKQCDTYISVDPVYGNVPGYRFQTTGIRQVDGIANVNNVFVNLATFFVTTADGALYGWGEGVAGLLANSGGVIERATGQLLNTRIDKPTRMAGLPPLRNLAFANDSAFALTKDGLIYVWGSDGLKLFGNGVRKMIATPTLYSGLRDVATIAGSGIDGLRLLGFDGSVISWGSGVFSNSSIQQTNFNFAPIVVKTSEKVRFIKERLSFFFVYFESGRINIDVTTPGDASGRYY